MRTSFLLALPLALLASACSSSESIDDIAPGDDTSSSGDTALPDTFVAKDSAADSSADVEADSAKADTADGAVDSVADGKTDATTDAVTDSATDSADVATDAGADTKSDATTDADATGDSVLADVLSDVALGGTCTLDSECASGLKCCAGGAAGLPKHCTAPTSGGTCPLVP